MEIMNLYKIAVLLLCGPQLLFGAREISVLGMEFHDGLFDNADEQVALKCHFLNPTTDSQPVTVSYWSAPSNARVNQKVTPTGPTDITFTLEENESYTVSFCTGKNFPGKCEAVGVINARPVRLKILVNTDGGHLLGHCITHYSKGANHHRAGNIVLGNGGIF